MMETCISSINDRIVRQTLQTCVGRYDMFMCLKYLHKFIAPQGQGSDNVEEAVMYHFEPEQMISDRNCITRKVYLSVITMDVPGFMRSVREDHIVVRRILENLRCYIVGEYHSQSIVAIDNMTSIEASGTTICLPNVEVQQAYSIGGLSMSGMSNLARTGCD